MFTAVSGLQRIHCHYHLFIHPLLIKNIWNIDTEACSKLWYYKCRQQLPSVTQKIKYGEIYVRSEILLKNKTVHKVEEGCYTCPAIPEVRIPKRL